MRTSCEDISSVHKMHENEDFSSVVKGGKNPPAMQRGHILKKESNKQFRPFSFRLRVGAWLWIWPQHCRDPILSSSSQCCPADLLWPVLMLCHLVQYFNFKHARILFGLLASPQDYLVFCLLHNKLIGLLSFLPSFCFSTCFCTISSTGLPKAD